MDRRALLLALSRVLRDPEDDGHGIGRGGGGHERGPEAFRRPTGRPRPAGRGRARGDHEKTSVRRESIGTRTVVR